MHEEDGGVERMGGRGKGVGKMGGSEAWVGYKDGWSEAA